MIRFFLVVSAVVVLFASPAWSGAQEESAEQLAALFRSYRKAIVMNPPSIHEPETFFSNPQNRIMLNAQAKNFYKASVGSSYSSSDGFNKAMQQAVENVMDRVAQSGSALTWSGENDYVKKWDGKLLPARFANLLASEFSALTHGAATIKLTTSPDLLVNTDNAPDAWEKRVIETKMVNSNTASQQTHAETVDGAFRLMLGEYYGMGCIGCHGTAPGQEGPKIHPGKIPRVMGDFAGAISISIKNSPAAAN